MSTIGKQALVATLTEKAGLTKKQSNLAFDTLVNAITEALESEVSVSFNGVLTLSVRVQNARTGRNPATGAPLNTPAKKVVRARIGNTLKRKIAKLAV